MHVANHYTTPRKFGSLHAMFCCPISTSINAEHCLYNPIPVTKLFSFRYPTFEYFSRIALYTVKVYVLPFFIGIGDALSGA